MSICISPSSSSKAPLSARYWQMPMNRSTLCAMSAIRTQCHGGYRASFGINFREYVSISLGVMSRFSISFAVVVLQCRLDLFGDVAPAGGNTFEQSWNLVDRFCTVEIVDVFESPVVGLDQSAECFDQLDRPVCTFEAGNLFPDVGIEVFHPFDVIPCQFLGVAGEDSIGRLRHGENDLFGLTMPALDLMSEFSRSLESVFEIEHCIGQRQYHHEHVNGDGGLLLFDLARPLRQSVRGHGLDGHAVAELRRFDLPGRHIIRREG
nr:MAG TPA: hypothetical protein [Caudoviricetes sp.]